MNDLPSIGPGTPGVPPEWARLEVDLMRQLQDAAREFVERYTLADGSLRWRAEWPGIDGSDDAYEAFWTLPLLYLLGCDGDLLETARREWEAVTWQWTQYGQVHREFDASYDWMHHGESSALFYLLGMADPTSLRERQRAVRFADFYTGADPEAPNYDPARRLIRSPLTGSRGPRFVTTAEDWGTHRSVLDGYPPPFEDIPANPDGTCTWTDDAVFEQILQRMNERMTRGDVPLNLTSSSLAAHAWLYTGQDRFRQWVLDYNSAWQERTERNGGIIPDNVGLDGTIGQNFGGQWWGGYYGWRWPHGARHIVEAIAVGGVAATLVSGDSQWLDHVRSQLDTLWDLGQGDGAARKIPNRYGGDGWYDYRQPDPTLAIYCWHLSQDPADLARVTRTAPPEGWSTPNERIAKGSGAANSAPWFAYIQGDNPDYPTQILRTNYRQMTERLAAIRADDLRQAPEWDIHHWQDRNPVMTEGLVQLMLGSPLNIYHGGLLATSLRYFDRTRRRPGLPQDVAALVEHVDDSTVTVNLVNCSSQHERELIVQAGGFGEHAFTSVRTDSGNTTALTGSWLSVRLEPSCQLRPTLGMRRFAGRPSYDTPWSDAEYEHPLLQGRSEHETANEETGT